MCGQSASPEHGSDRAHAGPMAPSAITATIAVTRFTRRPSAGRLVSMVRLSRGNVLFLVAVIFVGLLVVAVDRSRERSCEEWQERYEELDAGPTGTLDFVNQGPLAEHEESRPDGCPTPR